RRTLPEALLGGPSASGWFFLCVVTHMTVTLARLGDQRPFTTSRALPLGCHLRTNPVALILDRPLMSGVPPVRCKGHERIVLRRAVVGRRGSWLVLSPLLSAVPLKTGSSKPGRVLTVVLGHHQGTVPLRSWKVPGGPALGR